ncbi:MAG: PSD1 domain-containing protein [Bryobacterales bacterium]|nr:PSD1 domain-containing protein [Bryobacterales bacterium]
MRTWALLGVVATALHAQNGALAVLARECQGCHGPAQQLSRLDVSSRAALLRGGLRGPAVQPGNSAASLLVQAIEGQGTLAMPPGGPGRKLPADVIAAIRRWVDEGAAWPPVASAEASRAEPWDKFEEKDLWAFRPLRPRAAGRSIDSYLQGPAAPGPRADRRTLIRRVTFDLTGLPPTPDEVEQFVRDAAPRAWERLVDRLLASPRYGERWARHWLDVSRYADTAGYSNDFERPNAWRYRDYVIRAFNQDKPYDRFVLEQIAGDELFPGDADALIATGFLRMGPWEHTGMSVEAVTRQLFLDDVTHATASTFLGLTLGCARCHDHKFDPLPTRDYYRLQAVFATTEFARPPLAFLAAENTAGLAPLAAALDERVRRTKTNMDRFDAVSREFVMKKHGVTRADDLPKGVLEAAVRNKEGVGAEAFEEYKLYQKHLALYKESQDRYAPKAFAVSSGPLDGATDGGPNLRYPKRAQYQPPDVHILPGGNVTTPGEAVKPGGLSLLTRFASYPEPVIPEGIAGRRAALARWIADARNPLTARVMVNRIWQYHFGRGLAADASNFGKMGAKPTHPELLDALAWRFIDGGWSVKALHREILLTDAYQRAAKKDDAANARYAWFAPRRLEAEALRDASLAVSGELSAESGGPGAFPEINEDVARQPQQRMGSVSPAYHASARKSQRHRRSIYMFQQRTLVDPMVEVFNGPALDLACERRDASTVPTQAFALFNSRFAHDRALAMALRVERETRGAGVAARVERAFRLAYGREPGPEEFGIVMKHLARLTIHHTETPVLPRPAPKPVIHTITSELTGQHFRFVQQDDPEAYEHNPHPSEVKPATRALADLALILLNSNEFLYVY